MRCFLLLTITILVSVTFLPSPTVHTQQPEKDQVPKLADYPAAGANCKNKQQLAPWIGMANVTTTTARCEVSVYNCRRRTTDTYKSLPRNNNPMDCTDYLAWKERLQTIEVCCDGGEQPPEPKCEPPTGWFDRSLPCKEVGTPQLEISNGTATLRMCGYAVFSYRGPAANENDLVGVETYRTLMRDHLKDAGIPKVCCEKFREAVRTGHPCDPSKDLDCDGIPNNRDLAGEVLPDIDTFTGWDNTNAPIDLFPTRSGFDLGDPDFSPNKAARNSRGVGDCPCKWELIKGELKCSPPGRKLAYYQATWRCPKTGAEVKTTKYISATEYRCGQ